MWLLIFKQFQFVALSQRLNLMWLTISEARKHLLIFALMFLMLLIGFVLLVHEVGPGPRAACSPPSSPTLSTPPPPTAGCRSLGPRSTPSPRS